MNVGIIGCGLIGTKRANSIRLCGDDIAMVGDIDNEKAEALALKIGSFVAEPYQIINNPVIDAIVVSTPNKFLMPFSIDALEHGKHVLVEKPPGRNLNETLEISKVARETKKIVKVGFNHRFHPSIRFLHTLCSLEFLGKIMFIRVIYGHGGREGYNKEWRLDKDLSGGGELLDQGVHIVDLCRWFLGEFSSVYGNLGSYAWGKGDVEDNAFVLLKNKYNQTVQFHTSWTNWKNQFIFEIYGQYGCIKIDGLGGSYGHETITTYARNISGAPDEDKHIYTVDDSWEMEWRNFSSALNNGTPVMSDIDDAVKTMEVIEKIYLSNETRKEESL